MTTNKAEPFETETMAELCARQGRVSAAIAIYRSLLGGHPGHPSTARWNAKLAELLVGFSEEDAGPTLPHEVPIPGVPGVIAVAGLDDSGEAAAIVAWALPPTASPPVLEVMLVVKGTDGIETLKRRVTVASSSGRIAIASPGLHSAIAAVGLLHGEVFVPLARSPLPAV